MTETSTRARIATIRQFPDQLEALVNGFDAAQLTTAYNAPEWTIAQNVHHLVDAHMNGFIRFKLTLTEDNPTLRPYDQDAWAQHPDAQSADIAPSLAMLRYLHARWTLVLENINDWEKPAYHPEDGPVTLGILLEHYAAHCEAHITQIQAVIDKMP